MSEPKNNPVIRRTSAELLATGVPPEAQFLTAFPSYRTVTEETTASDGTTKTTTRREVTDDHDFYFVLRRDIGGGVSYQSMKSAALADLNAASESGRDLFAHLAKFTAPQGD